MNHRQVPPIDEQSTIVATPDGTPDFDAIRNDFPRARTAAYFDNASSHPLSVHSAAALHRYIDWVTHEVGEPWWPPWTAPRDESKRLFAKLINAHPEDIAFARSAVEAESNLINGMQEHLSGGNIVTHDLHYTASLYNYKMRERASALSHIGKGKSLRIVKHRDWQIDYRDMERAIDSNTKLVSITLVSNVNGYVSDVKAISDLAHAHGAYLYVDIIQGVGAVPVDVQAMGIDFAACSTFKWLMGVKGFGFLYVRSDLQGTVVKPTQHCGGLHFNYTPWVEEPDPTGAEYTFTPTPGPSCYEVSYPSYEGAICAQESLKYIHRLGVHNIRNHVRTLTDRLMEELPLLGYATITPKGNESPIVTFTVPDPATTMAKLRNADVHVAMRHGNKMRISPSVFTNQEDDSRLLEALAGEAAQASGKSY